MRKRFSIGEALLYAVLTLLALVTLYPLINLVAVSLSPRAEYLRNPMMIFPTQIDVSAYRMVIDNRLMWSSYRNTIIIHAGGRRLFPCSSRRQRPIRFRSRPQGQALDFGDLICLRCSSAAA